MTWLWNAPTTYCRRGITRFKREVLVVDDDRHFCELVRSLLGRWDIRVVEALSIEEGFAWLRDHENEVDAVIMDLVLPDGDGIEAIRRLKASYPWKKVIAASGIAGSEVYLRITGYLGVDAALSKTRVEALPSLLMKVLAS